MEQSRVVGLNGLGGKPGSGYMVAPHLVLASAHVCPEAGNQVTVFQHGRPSCTARVVWRGTPEGRDDAALVLVDDPSWIPSCSSSGTRWGRLASSSPGTPCETWGLPDVVQQKGRPNDYLHPVGTLNFGDRSIGNRYVMNVDGHPPAPRADGSSPWGGLSGGALFSGDLLMGVIAADPRGRAHGVLEAVPAYLLLGNPGFRAALEKYAPGKDLSLEAAEWQHLGHRPLPADAPLASPARLLHAQRQIVPFRGREQLIGWLLAWAEQPGFGAYVVHGPGGQGKTRLAQHVADRLGAGQYTVLWLRPDVPPVDLGELAGAARPVLVVVDYAETRGPQVLSLIEAALRRGSSGSTAFKILLLARTAGDWWTALQSGTHDSRVEDVLDATPVAALEALEPEVGISRLSAYREAVDSFVRNLPRVSGWDHHDWPLVAARLATPNLDDPGFGGALTLHMRALVDLLDAATAAASKVGPAPSGGSGSPGGKTIEDRLLVHERRYWETTAAAHGLGPLTATLSEALVTAFLIGAVDLNEADEVLGRLPGLAAQGGTTYDRRAAVREWICALYPPQAPQQVWGSLQPDHLAEHFVGRHLLRNPPLGAMLADGASPGQARRLLTVYMRAAAHRGVGSTLDTQLAALVTRSDVLAHAAVDVAPQSVRPEPLVTGLSQIVDRPETDLRTLVLLSDRLPPDTRVLAPWAARLSQRLVDEYRARTETDATAYVPLAANLDNLSQWLGTLGNVEQGLDAVVEAVAIRRALSNDLTSAESRIALAQSTGGLANHLANLGRSEHALEHAQQAAELCRDLVGTHPGVYEAELAQCLANLATHQSDLGDKETALATANEALHILRALDAQEPYRHEPSLAGALSNVATYLKDLNRLEEALAAASQSVEVLRRLAQTEPDIHQNTLAQSLMNLGAVLTRLGRTADALVVAGEAVDLHRDLSMGLPDAYRALLAKSLNNFAASAMDAGRLPEALAAAEEAVGIGRFLAETRPEAHRVLLATSLNNVTHQYMPLGRLSDALAAAMEAVDLCRDLERFRPGVHLLDLAMCTSTLSNVFGELGRAEDALALAEETLTLHRELERASPGVYGTEVAGSLHNVSAMYGRLGRKGDGLRTAEEAVSRYRELERVRPGTHTADVAMSLNNLSGALRTLARTEEALATSVEAVDILRALTREHPQAHRANLSAGLCTLSQAHEELGHTDEAVRALEEAIGIQRRMSPTESGGMEDSLAGYLNDLAVLLAAAGRPKEALRSVGESVDLYRSLRRRQPEYRRHEFATALRNQADYLTARGRGASALKARNEAAALLRELAAASPDVPLADLPTVLHELGAQLVGMGRADEAIEVLAEACDAYRALVEAHPDVPLYSEAFAGCLNNLGAWLVDLSRPTEAIGALEKAVALYRGLEGKGADIELSHYALTLNNLASRLVMAGRIDESAGHQREAITVWRRLAAETPAAHLPMLATSLNDYAATLAELGRGREAVAAAARAVDEFQDLAAAEPVEHGPSFAQSLANHAFLLAEQGRTPDSVTVGQEAVRQYRQLVDTRPDLLPKLGAALKNLAVDLGTERRTEEALAAIGEAIAIFGAPVKGTLVHLSDLETCRQVEAWLQRKR